MCVWSAFGFLGIDISVKFRVYVSVGWWLCYQESEKVVNDGDIFGMKTFVF